MTSAFLEGLSGKLGERWAAELLTPVAGFWAAGFAAWVLADGWDDSGRRLAHWFDLLSGTEQALAAVGGLLVLLVSAAVVEHVTLPVLRFLEGYWPRALGPLRRGLTKLTSRRLERAEHRLQLLEARRRDANLDASGAAEYARLDEMLRRSPAAPDELMPTGLGNTLRAGESRPRDKYGLDAVVCWPRLWLLLDGEVRGELIDARRQLDGAVALVTCGVLTGVWAVLSWWALAAAAVVSAFGYRRALRAATRYADLVESLFDLFRGSLYTALRVPQPDTPGDERATGEALTRYLWRGEADDPR